MAAFSKRIALELTGLLLDKRPCSLVDGLEVNTRQWQAKKRRNTNKDRNHQTLPRRCSERRSGLVVRICLPDRIGRRLIAIDADQPSVPFTNLVIGRLRDGNNFAQKFVVPRLKKFVRTSPSSEVENQLGSSDEGRRDAQPNFVDADDCDGVDNNSGAKKNNQHRGNAMGPLEGSPPGGVIKGVPQGVELKFRRPILDHFVLLAPELPPAGLAGAAAGLPVGAVRELGIGRGPIEHCPLDKSDCIFGICAPSALKDLSFIFNTHQLPWTIRIGEPQIWALLARATICEHGAPQVTTSWAAR